MPSAVHSLLGLGLDDLRGLLDAMPVGLVIVVDDAPPKISMNRPAAKMLGIEAGPLDALLPHELPPDGHVVDGGRERSLADWLVAQLDDDETQQRDITLLGQGGGARDLLANVGCLDARAGRARGCVVMLTDVSAEKLLGQELARQAAQQGLAADFSNSILVDANAQDVTDRAAETLCRGLDLELGLYLQHDPDTATLVVLGATGRLADESLLERREPVSAASQLARCFREHRRIVVRDYGDDATPAPLGLEGLHCGIAVPVWSGFRPVGVLAGLAADVRHLRDQDLGFADTVAHMASNGLSRIAAERRYLDSVRQLERARAAERVHRAARLSSLGTMASGIAHEVKNPINAIHMNAELAKALLGERADADQPLECLARIQADCQRAAEIADGILGFARGQGDADRETIEVAELFADLSRLCAATPGLDDMDLDFETQGAGARVRVNRTEFEQALINLVQNSAEAGARRVTVSARPDTDCVRLEIDDDGPGIPAELGSRVFDPFFTTRGESGGSGLGLSLVHRIVHDHGGDIELDTQRETGCSFRIIMPAEAPP